MPKRFTLAIALGAALPAMAAPAPKPPVGTVRLPVLSYTVNSAGPTKCPGELMSSLSSNGTAPSALAMSR